MTHGGSDTEHGVTVTVAEAHAHILSRVRRLSAEDVPLGDARGRVLAAAVVAATPVPPFANSAMDGYAVRAADIAGATHTHPARLRVVSTVAAGDTATRAITGGEAARIMTGAALPEGTDAVVPAEETNRGAEAVAVWVATRAGGHIRRAGEELAAGATALPEAARITPGAVGLLASLGMTRVSVTRRPRVAILSTGNELVPSGTTPGPGQIADANGPLLTALVAQYGGEPVPLGVVRDDPAAVAAALATVPDADFALTSGGASVGLFDVVRPFLVAHGTVDFTRVRMRPGQPCAAGVFRGVPFLALPGNPGAAFVTFHILARPALARLCGVTPELPTALPARLRSALHTHGGRDTYVRARLFATANGWVADTALRQSVGGLPALAITDALVRAPADAPDLPAGAVVDILPL